MSKPSSPSNGAAPLKVEVSDYIATVTIDRPPVNAVNLQLRHELLDNFDAFSDRDDVRVIVLTGTGKFFCAGADIKERGGMEGAGATSRHNRLVRETFNAVRECQKPVIAAVNGITLGAGMALAFSCDIVLASENAEFGMPEVNVGIAGGATVLQDIFSRSRMRRMMLTGRKFSAAELYRTGVIETCSAPGQLMADAMEIAREIASKSPVAVRYIKNDCTLAELMPRKEAHRLEQDFNRDVTKSEDAREARQAFLEKRPPVFKGR